MVKQLDCKWRDSVNGDDFVDAFLSEFSDYQSSDLGKENKICMFFWFTIS